MDNNPGISIFQATGLNIENPSQNQEEDEDVEEQKRRQEEVFYFIFILETFVQLKFSDTQFFNNCHG